MLLCDFEVKSGSTAEFKNQKYRIKEVEVSACGLWTAFLERIDGARSNYLSEEEDS